MITHLRARNFKSWEDTGPIRMAPLTALFGANSSGKTAILQLLLMLKQTVQSADRSLPLQTSGAQAYTDLGTFLDIVHEHKAPGELAFEIGWTLPRSLKIRDPEDPQGKRLQFSVAAMSLGAAVEGDRERISVERFQYSFESAGAGVSLGMRRKTNGSGKNSEKYDLTYSGFEPLKSRGRPPTAFAAPAKSYIFPDQVTASYRNLGFLSSLVLEFEQQLQRVYYLGPLREYPHRVYGWAGEQPQDVGQRGELAVPALLAAEAKGMKVGHGRGRQLVGLRVAQWLKYLGLIREFRLQAIGERRTQYEVRVRQSPGASEVLITDVGFGVSQILPVLTLCYYVPERSTIIMEQPEIHLHPAVQAGLADVFIDAIKSRRIQIILESHSEHLLRRLQRRMAEEKLSPDDTALYFAKMDNGRSVLERLEVDLFGNIRNWPESFFGDELGDLVRMTEAATKPRRKLTVG